MNHPFADVIDLRFEDAGAGSITPALVLGSRHLNPHGVVHGAVLYALADTGMGATLYRTLEPGEICATTEIKINYSKPVSTGKIVCKTERVNRGRTVANLESRLYMEQTLVAQANGNYAIFRPKRTEAFQVS